MASRYWVGGTAAWDGTAGTKWALTSGGAGGQTVPTTADDVFFTNLSTGTCTISVGNTGAKSIDCTGFTGTLAKSTVITVAGSITFSAGMTIGTFSADYFIITGTATLTSAGKNMGGININAPGLTVSLGDAFNGSTFLVTSGTFTTTASNFTMTAGAVTFSSAATIQLNGSTLTFAYLTILAAATFNAGTSTIKLTDTSSGILNGGGKTFNNVEINNTFAGQRNITGANTFASLTLVAPSSGIMFYSFDANQTITTFVCAGASAIRRIFLNSSTMGTARTITATTWTTVSDVDFRDITLTNAKSGTRLGNCGGNTNITFDAAKTVYWNLAGNQNWSATAWATSSGGAPNVNNFPLAQDTAVVDNASSLGSTITVENSWNVGTVNMSARTVARALAFSGTTFSVYGNWLTGTGISMGGGGGTISFSGRTTQTITSNGVSFVNPIVGTGVSNTITLANALTNTSTITLNGTTGLSLGSNTLTTGGFSNTSTSSRTLALGTGGITSTGAGAIAFTVTATGLTVTGSATISLTSASAKTFAGGGVNWGSTLNQGGAGALNITGANTFSNISNSYSATAATTITLAANQTVSNFTATGTVGKVLTLNSSVAGAARTLTKTSGTVGVNYLSIQDSTATGGAAWYAGANSTNVSNNTGWIFDNAPTASGNFLMMFM